MPHSEDGLVNETSGSSFEQAVNKRRDFKSKIFEIHLQMQNVIILECCCLIENEIFYHSFHYFSHSLSKTNGRKRE